MRSISSGLRLVIVVSDHYATGSGPTSRWGVIVVAICSTVTLIGAGRQARAFVASDSAPCGEWHSMTLVIGLGSPWRSGYMCSTKTRWVGAIVRPSRLPTILEVCSAIG